MADTANGASDNERLLYAARNDDVEIMEEIFDKDEFNINHQDGLGNTALHYAVSHGSTEVLEHILTHDECDVDPVNIHKQTPLHLAVQLEDRKLRQEVVESLLDAGADMSRKDKTQLTALNYVAETDTEIIKLFRRAQAVNAVNANDIASDDEEDGDDSDDDSDED